MIRWGFDLIHVLLIIQRSKQLHKQLFLWGDIPPTSESSHVIPWKIFWSDHVN
jgi:hypothetical protein